ncbi:pyridoxal phosphate-dependent aminotransferase [Porticoccus sp. GXU_MW_L64]
MAKTSASEYKPGLSKEEVRNLAGDQPIVKLSSNENPFGPSPLAVEAARKAVDAGNIYPPRNDKKLKKALAEFHGNGLTPEHFFSGNGGVEAISMVEDTLIQSGQRAIVTPPCFGAYISSLNKKGANIDRVPLIGDDFDVDVDGILKAVTDDTRLVYLCNPNNPTGTYFGDDVLDAVLDGLPEHVTVLYDEVYFQYATDFELPNVKQRVLDGRNLVVIHSFSKAYGLAGLRIGYGYGAPELVEKIDAKKRSFHLNAASMEAAIAALKDEAHIRKTVENNTAERPKLTEGIEALGLKVAPSQANLVMYECPAGTTADEMAAKLVTKGVMVRPAFFLPNHIRVSIGTPQENARFLSVLAELV